MRYFIGVLLIVSLGFCATAQTYTDSIVQFRKHYIEDLLSDARSPIKPVEVKNISFFPPDHKYCVQAVFQETPGSVPFKIPTHSGKQKPFREYGILAFSINSTEFTLHVYQSIDLVNDAAHKDYLFVPFNDLTNYETTYGGGRYIDVSVKDITDNRVVLDFNKCYNPYCAYADGFSCPIPPRENHLELEIPAGEKMFQH